MPKKKEGEFESNLKVVAIRRKDVNRANALKYGNEPFYSNFRRILDHFYAEKADLVLELKIQTEATLGWKKKYEEGMAGWKRRYEELKKQKGTQGKL